MAHRRQALGNAGDDAPHQVRKVRVLKIIRGIECKSKICLYLSPICKICKFEKYNRVTFCLKI